MQGSCRCQAWQATTRHLVVKKTPRPLNYLSSAGIRVILKARDALKKNNGKVTFMNLQPQIKKVFDIINALPSVQIFASIEELDEYLDAMQKKATCGADPWKYFQNHA